MQTNRLIAAVMAALALGVVSTKGIPLPGPNLPDQLSMIGSRANMCHWAATNRNCTLAVGIWFTNTSGQLTNRNAAAVSDGSRFTSYEMYKFTVMTNGVGLYNRYKTTMSPTTTLRFVVILYHVDINATGMFTDTNLGPASLIKSNSFFIEPALVQAVLPLTNFQRFEVEVQIDAERSYRYSWSPSSGGVAKQFVPPATFPQENTTTNLIVFTEWYSVAGARARYTIEGGQTNRYTQFGDKIAGKPLAIERDHINLFLPRGADAVLESSCDFSTWSPLVSFPSSLGTNRVVVPITIDPNVPRRFYRALVW